MNLVTHVKERALSKLKVVHGFGALAGEDDHTETVGEGPKHV